MKSLYSANFLSRVFFLLLTPVFFRYFTIGFVWHSVYWGVITMVVLIWGIFILLTPLIGRVGCGWFCFMGTTIDLAGEHAPKKRKWKKPRTLVKLLVLVPFFVSAFVFYYLNSQKGITHNFNVHLTYLAPIFDNHYKFVWMCDITAALLFGFFLNKRWACKNLCYMGAICSAGATYSRLLPVIDTEKCTQCGRCNDVCLTAIPITDYIESKHGLVTNSECVICGKCVQVCKQNAIKLQFVWNRKKYVQQIKSLS